MYACCLVLHEFLVCYGHLCSWIPLVVWAPRSRNSFSPCIGVPFASGAGEPCKYGYLFHTYPCKDSRSRPSARMGPKHANRLYHLCRPPLLCRRRHVLLFPWSPLGRGSAHGQRGQWLTDSGRRLRRRLQMRHSPQHRRHAAGRGGRSTRAASLDRQMTVVPCSAPPGLRGRWSTWTRREEDARQLPLSGSCSDMVVSPLPPRGGGCWCWSQAREGTSWEEDEVLVFGLGLRLGPILCLVLALGLGLNLEPRPKPMLKMEPWGLPTNVFRLGLKLWH